MGLIQAKDLLSTICGATAFRARYSAWAEHDGKDAESDDSTTIFRLFSHGFELFQALGSVACGTATAERPTPDTHYDDLAVA